jgi:hypothetical protein
MTILNGRARNKPCWCGSGRKLKRCHRTEKSRETSLSLDFGRPVRVERIELDRVTGDVQFWGDGRVLNPVSASLETTYGRAKGPKVLNRTFLPPGRLSLVPPRTLWRFDRLYAIDTNTRRRDDGTISVSAVYCGSVAPISTDFSAGVAELVACFEFRNAVRKPERIAWRTLIERVRGARDFSLLWRIGLIVDSELDALSDFNNRSRPIIDDFRLPGGFEFVYASGEVSSDGYTNRMLAMADKAAASMLDSFVRRDCPDDGLLPARAGVASHFRLWIATNDNTRARFQVVSPHEKLDSRFRRIEIVSA